MDTIKSNSDVRGSVYLRSVVSMYNEEMEKITELLKKLLKKLLNIDQIYERELKLLLQRSSDNTLSATETSIMTSKYLN